MCKSNLVGLFKLILFFSRNLDIFTENVSEEEAEKKDCDWICLFSVWSFVLFTLFNSMAGMFFYSRKSCSKIDGI